MAGGGGFRPAGCRRSVACLHLGPPARHAANTGFIDVTTAPATAPVQTAPGLGVFAPGAGPVIGTDGTANIGNFHGEVRAIRSDGSQAWKRTLLGGQSIIASPVIGADGSIYVVGTAWPLIRDHVGGGEVRRYDTTLYRFSSTGAMQWSTNFPQATPGSSGSGAAPASPNIWRSGDIEVIIVPARYDTKAAVTCTSPPFPQTARCCSTLS